MTSDEYIFGNVPERVLGFDAHALNRLVGFGPHHLIPESCSEAEIIVKTDDIVRIRLTCIADRVTLEQLAPELLKEIDAAGEWKSHQREGQRV
jgi:hypothetical protein